MPRLNKDMDNIDKVWLVYENRGKTCCHIPKRCPKNNREELQILPNAYKGYQKALSKRRTPVHKLL